MRLRERLLRWAIKSVGDRMTAEQLVTAVFGPGTSGIRMGSTELLKAYSTMPWLRAAVGRISWSVACVPWQLFVATAAPTKQSARGKAIRRHDIARSTDPTRRIAQYKALRKEDSLREITDHPALTLLDHGNARFPGQVARQVTQQHLDLVGEGAWLLDRSGLMLPSDIYPVPPTWIAQTPWDRMNGVQNIQGGPEPGDWILNSNRGTLRVPLDDMIYFYHPDPWDPYTRGTGTGHALGDELETDEATAKHIKRWFKNFAIPPMIISRKGGSGSSTKPNTDRLEENWMAKLMGRNNVPYFSTHELDVKELNQTFNDMQLSQLRKDERDILLHVYGMPPEVFGIIENSNRSTIDAADYLMAKYVTVPRLEFMRIILQQQLIEKYDERLILDYVSPVVEDKEFELKVTQAHPADFTVDEIRELANRRKLKDNIGDGFIVPINSAYVTDLREVGMAVMTPDPATTEPPADA